MSRALFSLTLLCLFNVAKKMKFGVFEIDF